MDYGDDYWGLYRDYSRDSFPHSLLSTREADKKPPREALRPRQLAEELHLPQARGLGFNIYGP